MWTDHPTTDPTTTTPCPSRRYPIIQVADNVGGVFTNSFPHNKYFTSEGKYPKARTKHLSYFCSVPRLERIDISSQRVMCAFVRECGRKQPIQQHKVVTHPLLCCYVLFVGCTHLNSAAKPELTIESLKSISSLSAQLHNSDKEKLSFDQSHNQLLFISFPLEKQTGLLKAQLEQTN